MAVKPAKPLTLTIFGITGDLSARMLLPAIYDLAAQGLLPSPFKIVGITRRSFAAGQLLDRIKQTIETNGGKCDPKVLRQLGKSIELFQMDLSTTGDYNKLRQRLDTIEQEAKVCMDRLFYMAIPAQLFDDVIGQLGTSGLNKACGHGTGESRLLIEKPFGHDLTSAEHLVKLLKTDFKEYQIYRIDHFLAKETAQNILTFRFQNPLFRTVWDHRHISHIVVSASEDLDIEGRANFYEQTGALRDMIQSHVLQMLALVAMEVPENLSAKAVHAKRLELLDSIKPADPNNALRGQYKGYRDEVSNQSSHVETYVSLGLSINSERWQGTKILLQTGKALDQKKISITVVFADHTGLGAENTLEIRLSPNEGISLHLRAKKPGFEHAMQNVTMDFDYQNSFAGTRQPNAYERVLIDAFRGDQTLFATSDEVLANWRVLEPVLRRWLKNDEGLYEYNKGSSGPQEATELARLYGVG